MNTYAESSIGKYKVTEGHLLPTSLTRKKFKNVLDVTRATSVFEIGFNAGHSARMWLDLRKDDPNFRVHSIDIGQHYYTLPLMEELAEQDPRFTYEIIDSQDLEPEQVEGYDMLFIDGSHEPDILRSDVILGSLAGVKYMLVDDYNSRGGFKYTVRKTVNSIVGDTAFKYCWYSKNVLHYESTGGISQMRLALSYKAWKRHTPKEHDGFAKQ